MRSISRFVHTAQGTNTPSTTLRGSSQFRFCTGKCQEDRPPEGGVELSPGRWRCGACWIEIARKRQ